MLKNYRKLTCLMLTGTILGGFAQSVPAFAAANDSSSSSTKPSYIKVNAEEGCINQAISFSENKFYINGDIVSEGNEGNYYLANGEYSSFDNDFSYDDLTLYDKKYISAENGEYYINLENGEIIDEDIQEDNLLDAQSNLRKKIKKDAKDRYSNYAVEKSLTELTNYKFNDTWYEAKYSPENTIANEYSDDFLTVYTDINGNYIDADYNLGKIKVVTTNKTVSITNTEEDFEETRISISNKKTIGHDSSNIYRTTTLTITSDEGIHKINGLSINDSTTAFAITNNGQTVSFNVIQKISKEQSDDDIDGAKYAKTVSTYVMSKDSGTKINLAENLNYSISRGKIITYSVSSDKVLSASTISLKTSKGYNFIGNKRISGESFDDYDVDSTGNLWLLNNGKIYRYATKEWTEAYKVDGSMNNISIYDSNNFVVWNTDDEVYSIYANKSDESNKGNSTEETLDSEAELDKTNFGWIKNTDGTWTYILSDSSKKTGWLLDNSKWYFLNNDGIMQTGWINSNNIWYYLASDGSMKTGWLNDNGTWYYLDSTGAMLSNTTIDGYVLDASGAWIK
ncbi:MAG: N-acetylmuramoyl-L-alanine amidase family protein [Clostridium sp.]|nr:N-acetylmuramoyl-L-alanine amidase family protein [Clostridium sp.]